METPSSTSRMTRSQTRKTAEKQPNQDRSALIDITNDSPIVGLAMGCLETPSSAISKRRTNVIAKFARTPGSGEALLRGQVKTLLQKVEEEAEVSKITIEKRPLFDFHGLVMNSPAISLVAPTPANTPQVLMNLSANGGFPPVTPSPVSEKILISQMVSEMKQEGGESDDMVTRSLMLDFSEKSNSNKSDLSDASSVVTYQGLEKFSTDDEDEAASIWSMQVNASSTRDEDEDEDFVEPECEKDDEYDDEEEEEEYGGDNYKILDELCEGISKMSVGLPKFTGKHIRFVYNSEDEIEAEEEEAASE